MTGVKDRTRETNYTAGDMNFKRIAILPLLASALFLAACGGSKDTGSPSASSDPGDGRPIEISTDDKMFFSVAEIRAKPGEKLSVTLVNKGSMPKQSMGHNWVLLIQGTNVNDFINASALAVSTEYIPARYKDAVVAHTRMLGPKERDTVTFTAPTTPGRHLFVCTFPGHFQVGMKGVLVVE